MLASASFWEGVEYVGMALVLIGALGEAVPLLPLVRKSETWKTVFEVVSLGLLVDGLAIELLATNRTNAINDKEIAVLQASAAWATALASADDVTLTNLEQVVASHKARADAAILALNKATLAATQEIKALRSPRVLTPKQMHSLSAKLRKFPGTRFWVDWEVTLPDAGSEQSKFAQQLVATFTAAGWTQSNRLSTNPAVVEQNVVPVSDRGCNVVTADMPDALKLRQAVATALHAVGEDCALTTAPGYPPGVVIVDVGLR